MDKGSPFRIGGFWPPLVVHLHNTSRRMETLYLKSVDAFHPRILARILSYAGRSGRIHTFLP